MNGRKGVRSQESVKSMRTGVAWVNLLTRALVPYRTGQLR